MSEPVRILILEDSPLDAELAERELRREGIEFTARRVVTENDFRWQINEFLPNLILSDYNLPGFDGFSALALAREQCPETPFVLVSGVLDEETVVDSLHSGATDYVLKQRLSRLGPVVRRALREADERSQRRFAERARLQSDVRYRSLVETAFDWVWEVDDQGRYTYSSARVYDLLGYRPEEIIGRMSFDLMPPAEAQRIQASFKQYRDARQPFVMLENINCHRNGRLVVLESNGMPILADDGTLLGFRGMDRDITVRKQAEQALRLSEERFSKAFHTSPAGMTITRIADGKFVDANESFCQMLEYGRDEVIGHTSTELNMWTPEERQKLIDEQIKQGGLQNYELQPRAKSGKLVSLLFSSKPMEIAGEEHHITIMIDITERKQAQESLRESEERFRLLVEKSPYAIGVHQDGKIVFANPSAVELFGSQDLENLIGKPIMELISPETQEAARQRIGRMLQGETGLYPAEDRYVRLDGRVVPVEVTAAPFTHQGRPAIQVIVLDITERKQADEEIRLQIERLRALHAIDQAITSNLELHFILDLLLKQVTSHLCVDAAILLLFNQSTQTLEYAAGIGLENQSLQHTKLQLGAGYAGRVVLDRQTIHVPNVMEAGGDLPRALLLARESFVAYYGVPLIAKGQVKGVLEIFHRTPHTASPNWLNFLETLAGQAAIAIEDAQLYDGLQQANTKLLLAYDATIEGWSRAMDLRDKETEGHTLRVTELTLRLGRAIGMNDEELVHIRRGALLHDMGKLGVPDAILLKPDKLTDEEWGIMRQHPQYAYEMLRPIDYLRPALDIPYCHHEKWDGTGYPRGLQGEQIPLAARLFAVADVWDALQSDRPYRKAWPKDKTLAYIRLLAGTHFDPRIVKICLESDLLVD